MKATCIVHVLISFSKFSIILNITILLHFLMSIKELLKPTAPKALIFLFIAVFYLYFAGESACGIGFFFAFCYKAYGFPFLYVVAGDINTASGYIKTLPLGDYFSKFGKFLFNPLALILDIFLIYLLACFISTLFIFQKIKT